MPLTVQSMTTYIHTHVQHAVHCVNMVQTCTNEEHVLFNDALVMYGYMALNIW